MRDSLLELVESGRFTTPLGVTPSGVDGMKVNAKGLLLYGRKAIDVPTAAQERTREWQDERVRALEPNADAYILGSASGFGYVPRPLDERKKGGYTYRSTQVRY